MAHEDEPEERGRETYKLAVTLKRDPDHPETPSVKNWSASVVLRDSRFKSPLTGTFSCASGTDRGAKKQVLALAFEWAQDITCSKNQPPTFAEALAKFEKAVRAEVLDSGRGEFAPAVRWDLEATRQQLVALYERNNSGED